MTDRVGVRFFEGQAAVSMAVLRDPASAPGACEVTGDGSTDGTRVCARRTATTLAGKAALLAAMGSPCSAAELYPYVEVRRDHYGAPQFVFKPGCPLGAPGMATMRPRLSLSHDAPYALACTVLAEGSRPHLSSGSPGQDEGLATVLRELLAVVLCTGEARRAFLDVYAQAVRGVGVDIVAIGRLSTLVEARADVLPGLFTPAERAEAGSAPCAATYLAKVFAAKEAVFKTLQSAWPDDSDLLGIEVLGVADATVQVTLGGGMAALARSRGVDRFVVAVAQHQTYGAAAALALR